MQARPFAPLLVVVRAAADVSERTARSVAAAVNRDDRVVVALTSGGGVRPTRLAGHGLTPGVVEEAGAGTVIAAHAAAGGVTLVVDDGAWGPEARWIDHLVGSIPPGGVALPATNAGPWPVCPPDLPDAHSSRTAWRDFARTLGERPAVPVVDQAHLIGPAVALSPEAGAAVGGTGAAPAALAAVAFAAGAPVVRAEAVYVHDDATNVLLSACLIVKDEVDNLARCLASVASLVDEVVVYDTGSTDGTIDLARSLGAVVVEGFWDDDFSRARNAARSACRGAWLLHVDADEEIENPAAAVEIRRRLAGDPPLDLVAVPLHNLTGTELAPLRAANPLWVPRLVHRARCRWTGALHEHPSLVGGGTLRTAREPGPSILHSGYLDEVVARRDKAGRNARIAETGLAATVEEGRAHFDRARTFVVAGRMAEALEEYAAAAEVAENPIHRRCALEQAASILLNLGRPDEAEPWIARREAIPELPGVGRWLRARQALARSRHAEVLEWLEGIEGYADAFSTNGPDGVHVLRAEARSGLQRFAEAAADLTAAVALSPGHDRAWTLLIRGAERWPEALVEAARHLPADLLKLVAARLLAAPAAAPGLVAEALWTAHPNAPAVLALGVKLGPRLDLEDAARWAVRLRAAGLEGRCPLRAVAADEQAPVLLRLQAAHLGAELFGDPDLVGLRDALAAVA